MSSIIDHCDEQDAGQHGATRHKNRFRDQPEIFGEGKI